MLTSLFRNEPAAAAPCAPAGVRLYAIGDVHGRLDLFEQLLGAIGRDHAARGGGLRARIVALGDYIDRGPHSAQLLDRLLAGPPPFAEWTLLRGNHEQAMLDQLTLPPEGGAHLVDWLAFGGRDTLRSYAVPSMVAYGADEDAILRHLRAAVPPAHLRLLQSMPLSFQAGDYFFAHAGIRPGVALADQTPADLLMIRSPFLGSRESHGKVVVHGHSIVSRVEEKPNRIGIDTGAYMTGRLTALGLENTERWYLQTSG